MGHLHTVSGIKGRYKDVRGKSASRYFHAADAGCDMRAKAWTIGENLSDGSKNFLPNPSKSALSSSPESPLKSEIAASRKSDKCYLQLQVT